MHTDGKAESETVLRQLGGNRFGVMTGLRFALYGVTKDGLPYTDLRFRGGMSKGINHLRITLDLTDTYTLEWWKVTPKTCAVIGQDATVYADQLRSIFEARTGFSTSL